MKKFLSILIVIALSMAVPVFAVESGSGVKSGQVTLWSAATGTTAAKTLPAYTFDNVMKYGACDLISGPSKTTGNVTIVIYGNQGSSSTLFDSTAYLVTSTTMAGSLTASVMKTLRFSSGVAAPFRTISAVVTSPSTTQVITVNCSAIQ